MDYNDTLPIARAFDADFAAPAFDTPAHAPLQRFASVEALARMRPAEPVMCMHPEKIREAARAFLDHFPGHSLYAVKANPDPYVLRALYDSGIRHFDVASLGEVRLARELFPLAHLAFMNPVKSREAIRAAYFDYHVRDFVIDTFEEMHKILEETNNAQDLLIVVRLAMPKGSAACQLTGKFGCTPDAAVELLRAADKAAHRVGLSFHVGSQTLDPASYVEAIDKGGEVARRSGVELDVFDIGGGFPIRGLGMDIPPLTDFFTAIGDALAAQDLPQGCEVWSEPGRALSGDGATLLVRVELRKKTPAGEGDLLYINDGSFGNMFEVCSMGWQNDVALLRPGRAAKPGEGRPVRKAPSRMRAPFRFYGPTCDSVDVMPGPFLLPQDACEGDYIALQGMGSYMACSRSGFNGFDADRMVEIDASVAAPRRRRSNANLRLVE